MKTKIKGLKGFTLVELLIVIALIAILSVAVLATINPIEQTNKARDAKFKNDAAEVLGALERYYASQNAYPWNNAGVAGTVPANTEFAVGSSDPLFGVIGVGGTAGVLVTTSELKSSFVGKEPFTSTDPVNSMYVYHNGLDSNYVCFVPKATANKYTGGSVNPLLKCMQNTGGVYKLYDLNDSVGAGGALCGEVDWKLADANIIGPTKANLICVPEGAIN